MLAENAGFSVKLPAMMADREQLSLRVAALPDQEAEPMSMSFSPSEATMLSKLALRAVSAETPEAAFSVTVITAPLALEVP